MRVILLLGLLAVIGCGDENAREFIDDYLAATLKDEAQLPDCLLYQSPRPRAGILSRMPSAA